MKHTTKKAMSWLLSLALMLSLVPTLTPTARAEDEETEVSTWESDDCTVTLIDGVLIVSKKEGNGNGAMANYDSSNDDENKYAPWAQYSSSITAVVIEEGVTSVGNQAFMSCTNLTSVTISNSVVKIGTSAFRGCKQLTGVIISSGVTQIGQNAFNNCTNLTWVTIKYSGDRLTTLGKDAFKSCSKLAKIYVPSDSVEAYKNATNWGAYADKISAIPSHSVTVTEPTNGAVTADPSALYGDTVTLTVTPDAGYMLDTLTVTQTDNQVPVEVAGDNTFTFIMPNGNVTVSATFRQPKLTLDLQHGSFTASYPADGDTTPISIDNDGNVPAGAEVTLKITPDSGYELLSVAKDGDNLAPSDGTYTFTMPAKDVFVQAYIVPASTTASFEMNVVVDTAAPIRPGDTITGHVELTSDKSVAIDISAFSFGLSLPDGVTDLSFTEEQTIKNNGSTINEGSQYAYIAYSDDNESYVTIPANGSLKLVTFTAKVGSDALSAGEGSKTLTIGLTGLLASPKGGSINGVDSTQVSAKADSGEFVVTNEYTLTFELGSSGAAFSSDQPNGAEAVYDDEDTITAYTITVIAGHTVGEDGLIKVEKSHYDFSGWVYASDSNPFDESTVVTASATLVPGDFTRTNYRLTVAPADPADETEFYRLSYTDESNITASGTNNIVHNGDDITFTLTPVGDCVLGVQYRVGTDGTLGTDGLTKNGDTYTLSGSQITGDITIVVSKQAYHSIEFKAGPGTIFSDNTSSKIAWVRDGETTLYSSLDAVIALDTNAIFTVPTVAVLESEGYRAVKEDEGEYLWLDNKNSGWTSADVGSRQFASNVTTLTAQAVKQVSVRLLKKLADQLDTTSPIQTIVIDEDKSLPVEYQNPTLPDVPGYKKPEPAVWKNKDDDTVVSLAAATFSADTDLYVEYTHGTYNIVFDYSDEVDIDNETAFDKVEVQYWTDPNNKTTVGELTSNKKLEGIATHGTTLYIQVSPKEGKAITGCQASVGYTNYQNGTYLFTIDGAAITDNITISFAAADGITIIARAVGGTFDGGSSSKTVTVYPENGVYTVDRSQFVVTGDENYDDLDVTAVNAIIPEHPVLADGTVREFTLTCRPKAYSVTIKYQLDGGEAVTLDVTGQSTTYFAPYSYTLTQTALPGELRGKCLITGATIQIGNGEAGEAANRVGGTVTLSENTVNGALVITYQLASVTWEWIKKDTYKALENGTKIAVLKADGAENGSKTYTLNGATMYWSSRYGAFLAIVADNEGEDETDLAVALCGALVRSNMSTTDDMRLKYNGDVTGNGSVNVIDTVPINDALHGVATYYLITDQMRLEMDVVDVDNDSDNLKTVDLQDVLEILQKAVGRINKLPHETDPS